MNRKILITSIIIMLLSISACNSTDTKENNMPEGTIDGQSVQDFISTKTGEEIGKDKEIHDSMLEMLDQMAVDYDNALDDIQDEENEDTIKAYKNSRNQLGAITMFLDSNINTFPQHIFLSINDKIIEIDTLMAERKSAGDVEKLIDEIRSEIDQLHE